MHLRGDANQQSNVVLERALWQGTPVMVKRVNRNVDSELEEMLRNEINLVRNLSHRCIPRYYGWGETENELFLVMELLNGASLEKVCVKALVIYSH